MPAESETIFFFFLLLQAVELALSAGDIIGIDRTVYMHVVVPLGNSLSASLFRSIGTLFRSTIG